MAADTVSYKCPACGSPLTYQVTGELACASCGNTYQVDVIRKLNEEGSEQQFDWSGYRKEFDETSSTLEDTKTYICQSCGAEIETTGTTVATHCPYCDNEVVITDRVKGGLKPNYVIPFAITREEAEQAVKNHFKGKKLLPGAFHTEAVLDRIQGLYVPFWLFSSAMDGSMSFRGTKVRVYSDSKYRYTETSHYLVDLDGSMAFHRIPVDGSEKMDDDLMDAIEPFDYEKMVDFNSAYLSGYLADRFDDDPDESLPRATERMKTSVEQVLRAEADDGYTTFSQTSSHMNLVDPSVRYALLPVYLLNATYRGKRYRFAVNGQTGKVVGELPISRLKEFAYFLGTTAIAGVIGCALACGALWLLD